MSFSPRYRAERVERAHDGVDELRVEVGRGGELLPTEQMKDESWIGHAYGA